jgi:hypothetical protein
MGKTNFNGEDVTYLNWIDSLYRFIVINPSGETVLTTGTTKISATPTYLDVIEDIVFTYDKFNNFQYNLSYQDDTQNFVLTYTKPSGEVQEVCLKVVKTIPTGHQEICHICETSASATLFCNIASYGNGTYLANFYATGSFWNGDSLTERVGGTFSESIFVALGNDDGSFYAFLFAGIVGFCFFVNPVIGIIGFLLGMMGAAALGFTAMQWSGFMGITAVGFLIIWLIKK